MLSRLNLSVKLLLLVGLSAVALTIAIAMAASMVRQRMLDDRVDKLQSLVVTARGFAEALERQAQAGTLTREQAMAQFRDQLHTVRFGAATDYFLAQTDDGLVIMHGGDPKREGKPTTARDEQGRSSADLAAVVLRSADGGVITYSVAKPGSPDKLPKLSYVARFAPWKLNFITGAWTDDIDAAVWSSLVRLVCLGLLILAVMLPVAWLIARDIKVSLSRVHAAIEQLAQGDLAADVPGRERRDQIGGIARAVFGFKEYMQETASEQDGLHRRADVVKREALMGMADKVEAEISVVIEKVGERTAAMVSTADALNALAARTDGSAQHAAMAANQALANAHAVASAAEQLSVSIREIGGQVARSTAVVASAVEAGMETRRTIEALNGQVGQIGSVADMIGAIAAKTNLLALNATIEAARAGDAGKGFAVVAGEVKVLAAQTARSTEEIARHIEQVRAATNASVAAVGRIDQTIADVEAIANSIAAAVEQQGAATAEIARNVTETATAANAMNDCVSEVSGEAEQTGRHAVAVRDDAANLKEAVDQLRRGVVRSVRTSTEEVDRRATARYRTEKRCRLNIPGQPAHSAIVTDLSERGARVQGGPKLRPGDRGAMTIDGMNRALTFVVRGVDGTAIGTQFDADAEAAAQLAVLLESFGRQQAA